MNSKVSKNIRNQGETLFCWAFAISTMLRQSLKLFISSLNKTSYNTNDALRKLNSVDFHRRLRNELIMIPIPKNLSNEFNQDSALYQAHYLHMAFERVIKLYGGYGEMAQKVIEGDMSHVKWYAWEIEMAQFENDSESRSRVFLPRWLTFSD